MEQKNPYLIWIVLAIILLAAGAFWYFNYARDNGDTLADQAKTSSYTNDQYGYSLDYPSSLEVKEYNGENTAFGDVAEVRVITIPGQTGETFDEAVAREMSTLCAADGEDSTFSCTGAEGIGAFQTDSGMTGYEFYLNGELRNLETGEITDYTKGPYFAFLLNTGATASSALVIYPPMNQMAEQTDAKAIRAMAKSLTFKSGGESTIELEAYISEQISELAPVKEQLGGKFFVTDIEAWGGSGTVYYEDGHNAYVADFTYEMGTDGKFSILSFKLRK